MATGVRGRAVQRSGEMPGAAGSVGSLASMAGGKGSLGPPVTPRLWVVATPTKEALQRSLSWSLLRWQGVGRIDQTVL